MSCFSRRKDEHIVSNLSITVIFFRSHLKERDRLTVYVVVAAAPVALVALHLFCEAAERLVNAACNRTVQLVICNRPLVAWLMQAASCCIDQQADVQEEASSAMIGVPDSAHNSNFHLPAVEYSVHQCGNSLQKKLAI